MRRASQLCKPINSELGIVVIHRQLPSLRSAWTGEGARPHTSPSLRELYHFNTTGSTWS